jgi:hypothetical protein
VTDPPTGSTTKRVSTPKNAVLRREAPVTEAAPTNRRENEPGLSGTAVGGDVGEEGILIGAGAVLRGTLQRSRTRTGVVVRVESSRKPGGGEVSRWR